MKPSLLIHFSHFFTKDRSQFTVIQCELIATGIRWNLSDFRANFSLIFCLLFYHADFSNPINMRAHASLICSALRRRLKGEYKFWSENLLARGISCMSVNLCWCAHSHRRKLLHKWILSVSNCSFLSFISVLTLCMDLCSIPPTLYTAISAKRRSDSRTCWMEQQAENRETRERKLCKNFCTSCSHGRSSFWTSAMFFLALLGRLCCCAVCLK